MLNEEQDAPGEAPAPVSHAVALTPGPEASADPGPEDARQVLKEKLRRPFTHAWLGGILGVDQSCISLWVHGKTRPEKPHVRAGLQALFEIPETWWMTPEERAIVARATEERERLAAAATGAWSSSVTGPVVGN